MADAVLSSFDDLIWLDRLLDVWDLYFGCPTWRRSSPNFLPPGPISTISGGKRKDSTRCHFWRRFLANAKKGKRWKRKAEKAKSWQISWPSLTKVLVRAKNLQRCQRFRHSEMEVWFPLVPANWAEHWVMNKHHQPTIEIHWPLLSTRSPWTNPSPLWTILDHFEPWTGIDS